ncbi:shikimate kinase 3, chloroplastic-like [Macadamia integrifolia]|uniref:shikimate kinase 3, chloroplastic-like n=1 Tax=Macadamia integrifolia TaxID=60698 RepID=UPI001C501F85|nr:shikimate kinase 3, chloroplastic-like [Macadamia integrifolia]XP_042493466.1 shikimate kinase 3, chloroplastic-like [Macadamia integrifolia]
MEAATATTLQFPAWTGREKIGRKTNGFFRLSHNCGEDMGIRMLKSRDLQWRSASARPQILVSYKNSPASELESGKVSTPFDEALILKKKAQEVGPQLDGRCIYLVGMMGSGKTTVGKIISEVLGYSFFDSDKLVEEAVGVTSVAQIFKQYSESFFRDNETEVLRKLSLMRQLVIATGGGVVIRPINWKYMKQGVTVWLDVPLEALARRIAAVGTDSRPLLHGESGDAYSKALLRLSTLFKERGEAYDNADAKVSLPHIAAKLGLDDACDLTPTAIAIEALVQIENFVKRDDDMTIARNP